MQCKIPVISMWQPWANWVSLGWKTIETRTHTRFKKLKGKTIGIHAAVKWDKDWKYLSEYYLDRDKTARTEKFLKLGGAIICVADVIDFRVLDKNDSHLALIDCHFTERYGLILSNIKTIEAIPCKGRQGIWYENIEL